MPKSALPGFRIPELNNMPRKAPDKVIEHRISLSNFERSQIIEQLEKQRDNKLLASGINQVGAIAGSSLLLYGLGLYLGINLLKEGKDWVYDFVDDASSSLADFAGDVLNPAIPNTAEAEAIRSFYDRIDEAKVYHRNQERLNAIALNALVSQLRVGDITLDEFTAQAQPLRDEGKELDQLRTDILQAYRKGRYFIVAQRQYPQWIGQSDWRDVVNSGKGWTGPNSQS
tara:strand:- start:1541 stop:2224 length:684 start_codon:yes stop_codon:yes gene_type:complete